MAVLTGTTTESLIFNSPYISYEPGKTEWKDLDLGAAKKVHPERWSGKTRNWNHEGTVELNPVNQDTASNEDKISA